MAFGFLLAIMLFTLIISMTGVDFVTALGAVAGNITNSGLGDRGNRTGPVVLPDLRLL